MRNLFAFLILFAVIFGAVESRAQISQFSQPTSFTTTTTNSPLLAQAIANVSMPYISLSITVTNPVALITNTFNSTFTNGPVSFTIQRTFVFNAATMGTNFSTNWYLRSICR